MAKASDYIDRLSALIQALDREQLNRATQLIEDAWATGRQIIAFGNGGSALTALHYINDWSKTLFMAQQRQFFGRTLVDNIGLAFSYANDVSFEDVFREQLRNILKPDDLVIAISGSGNSENVIRAVQYANEHGAVTLGICGYDGGRLRTTARHVIWVPANDMQLSEDIHFIFGHVVMQHLAAKRLS